MSHAPLGPPLDLRAVAQLLGVSCWTVRQTLMPKGLPYFRTGPGGKLIFYESQVIAWVHDQQQRRKDNMP